MPKENIDYSKTIIYKIVCKDIDIKDCYVGSTTDFVRRRYKHKSASEIITHQTYVYDFIRQNGGWNNWEMIEIEKYNASNHNDALKRERYWFEELKATLNMKTPSRSGKEFDTIRIKEPKRREYNIQKSKEYRENNKEYVKENNKEYRENNRDKIKEYKVTKILCACGCVTNISHTSRHKKSQFHLNFLNQQIE